MKRKNLTISVISIVAIVLAIVAVIFYNNMKNNQLVEKWGATVQQSTTNFYQARGIIRISEETMEEAEELGASEEMITKINGNKEELERELTNFKASDAGFIIIEALPPHSVKGASLALTNEPQSSQSGEAQSGEEEGTTKEEIKTTYTPMPEKLEEELIVETQENTKVIRTLTNTIANDTRVLQEENSMIKLENARNDRKAAINKLGEAISGAKTQLEAGKVDENSVIEDLKKLLEKSEKTVLEDPADNDSTETLLDETEIIKKETKGLNSQVTVVSEAQEARKARLEKEAAEAREAAARAAANANSNNQSYNTSSSSGGGGGYVAPSGGGGGGWFSEMRQILNAVGGSHVSLVEYDGNCSGVSAPACSSRGGTIKVHPSISGWSSARKYWAMSHELAHQYQFNIWNSIMSSPTYQSSFNGDIEYLANCMTNSKGFAAHGRSCSASQIAWASTIWSGYVS